MPRTPAPTDFSAPVSPAEILTEEFLKPLDLSVPRAAEAMNIPRDRLAKIVSSGREITTDTALRLGRLLGTSPEFWLNLQSRYRLRLAAAQRRPDIEAIERYQPGA